MKISILIFILAFALSIFGQQKMSEREFRGLKGKVKRVTTTGDIIESKNYYKNTLGKFDLRVEFFDENGVPVETIDNESNYKDTYTFIDGDLTSKSHKMPEKNRRNLH